ncbi:unnamed protein product [Moneuplotes crassus]|uniref:Uncharacterized protein n=1 Tax=Euplotes crassus TaxID=5936 RepID=A0AAD1XEV8_EUPCR|nr:unnamed protein product [Moneuplotes crassus]
MVKVHGRQSKRQSLRRRYNIQKKIRGHKKKQSKLARKLKKSGAIKPRAKEPGIPNMFPFKKEMMDEAEMMKQREAEQKRLEKQDRKQMRMDQQEAYQNKNDGEKDDLEDYMETVNSKIIRYTQDDKLKGMEEKKDLTLSDSALKQSKKVILKELKSVIEQADVVIEIIDARDPQGCRNLEIENMVLEQNKKLILMMTKSDLVPYENSKGWLKVLRKDHSAFLFESNILIQKRNTPKGPSKKDNSDKEEPIERLLNATRAIGAEEVATILKTYCCDDSSDEEEEESLLTVAVIGYPNVGKKSFINSLKCVRVLLKKHKSKSKEGNKDIYLDRKVRLLNTPGLVLSKDNSESLILRNIARLDDIEDPVAPVEALIMRINRKAILREYRIPNFNTIHQFLAAVAKKTGKLSRGGVPDNKETAKLILRDWNHGRIPYFTPVPAKESEEKPREEEMDSDSDSE